MTPKEKQTELFIENLKIIDRYIQNDLVKLEVCKQLCLLNVSEVRQRDLVNGDWWDEVKQEIEKL